MKKIEAIIRPEKFDIIKDALTEQGYGGMSVSEMKGHGNQKGVSEVWRGKRYRVDLLPKIKLELIVSDDAVDKVVQTIINESQTGSIGDGKIFSVHMFSEKTICQTTTIPAKNAILFAVIFPFIPQIPLLSELLLQFLIQLVYLVDTLLDSGLLQV